MAQEPPKRIVEWYLLARARAPEVRRLAAEWLSQVLEEPRLLWETPTLRYLVYGSGGLLAVWLFVGLVNMFQPANQAARPAATTADYHVICADPECGRHFQINRKFGFRAFPVQCPACRGETGRAARRCSSPTCKGAWVVPVDDGGARGCPRCATEFATP